MGKHLTAQDIEDVVRLLDGWTGKLTWPELCKACKPVIGTIPTRQTLMKFSRVTTAFALRKGTRRSVDEQVKGDAVPSMAVYAKRLFRLQQENERLNRENNQLLNQFIVWQYNAYAHGLAENSLNHSLPKGKSGDLTLKKKKKATAPTKNKYPKRTP